MGETLSLFRVFKDMGDYVLFVRKHKHYFMLLLLLVAYLGTMTLVMRHNIDVLDRNLREVEHSNTVIGKAQNFALLVERMVASQRGFVLSGDEKLSARYEESKGAASNLIVELSTLMQDNPAQVSRLNELQHHFLSLSEKLDALAHEGKTQPAPTSTARGIDWKLDGEEQTLNGVRDDLMRVTQDALADEQALQGQRMRALEDQRIRGRVVFICTGMLFIVFLFAFNGYVLRTRGPAGLAGAVSDDPAHEIFRLASEASSDGIFEWDISTDRAFYSRQFWSMLGYEADRFSQTMQAFKDLLHPEDRERVVEHIENYLGGAASEYLIVFRMKHQSGRWVWINARGRALYDEQGKPHRIVGAHTDISHIKAYEEKLQKAKEYAENANRAKTDFLAHMSHEIRTPLTAISGIAEIFEGAQENLDPKQRQLVKVLNSSTSSLKDLVSDILDFSRIESGELELDEKSFGLQNLFEQVVSIVSLKAGEKSIEFNFDYDHVKKQKFLGDRARLRQILINLIGNAVKFTDKGAVTVMARKEARDGAVFLRIDVKDTGIGIDPQNFDLIFERFKQADSSVSRRFGGSGLGLPISLRLAKLMGGDITVESAPGKGSVFTLVVPLKTEEVQEDTETDRKIDEALSETIRRRDGDSKNILLVEDYEGNIVILSYLLESLQCQYDVARTGLQALNMWKDKHYDLILMDVQMPEMDGFTATAQIRRMEQEKDIPRTPIIGMTAHALVGDREKCIEAGMDAYLPKPIVELDLKARITEFLGGKSREAA